MPKPPRKRTDTQRIRDLQPGIPIRPYQLVNGLLCWLNFRERPKTMPIHVKLVLSPDDNPQELRSVRVYVAGIRKFYLIISAGNFWSIAGDRVDLYPVAGQIS